MQDEPQFKTVCELREGTKAYKAQLSLDIAEVLSRGTMKAYLDGEIDFKRYCELDLHSRKVKAKAWKRLTKFSGLPAEAPMRVKRTNNHAYLEVQIEAKDDE